MIRCVLTVANNAWPDVAGNLVDLVREFTPCLEPHDILCCNLDLLARLWVASRSGRSLRKGERPKANETASVDPVGIIVRVKCLGGVLRNVKQCSKSASDSLTVFIGVPKLCESGTSTQSLISNHAVQTIGHVYVTQILARSAFDQTPVCVDMRHTRRLPNSDAVNFDWINHNAWLMMKCVVGLLRTNTGGLHNN